MSNFHFLEAKKFIDTSLQTIEYPSEPKKLYESIQYVLNLKAKRIRPILVLFSSYLFSEEWKKFIQTALAFEIFHNFTLVHDDIIDNADLRRGELSVHKKYDKKIAINSGDAMLVQTYKYLLNDPMDVALKLIKDFNKTATDITVGQQRDLIFEERQNVSMEEYIEMIGGKTASLIALAIKTGGILTRQTEEVQNLLYDIGFNAGLAFQIQDDFLDLYSSEKFGKQIGGDIINNKKSYLYAKAYSLGNEDQRKILYHIYENITNENEKIKSALNLFDSMNVKMQVAEEIDFYTKEAIINIERLKISSNKKEEFINFLDSIKNRSF